MEERRTTKRERLSALINANRISVRRWAAVLCVPDAFDSGGILEPL